MKNKFIALQKLIKAFVVFSTIFISQQHFADGSVNLFPSTNANTLNGISPIRSVLRSLATSTSIQQKESWPFPNLGTHYVYVKKDERIAIASSAQEKSTKRIKLYDPNGAEVSLSFPNDKSGIINNRNEELAGPAFDGITPDSNKYRAVYYKANMDGVYRVEFISKGVDDPSSSVLLSSNSWTQGNNAGIVAWDISVINQTNNGFIKGRVYTNILNLSNGHNNSNPQNLGFYSIVYVLTKDGYRYKVSNNGGNGMYFTFMVNNNGFIKADGTPTYKSLDTSTLTSDQMYNPNWPDSSKHITHKIFYTEPDKDLPSDVLTKGGANCNQFSAEENRKCRDVTIDVKSGDVGMTWFFNTIKKPIVTNVEVEGEDGTHGQMGYSGSVKFSAAAEGYVTVVIESPKTPADFVKRTIVAWGNIGENSIEWDGKGGDGKLIPKSDKIPIKTTVQMQSAEVHFPYLDMEYNKNGIIIERLDGEDLVNSKFTVYWDDSDLTTATNGTSGANAYGNVTFPVFNSHLSNEGKSATIGQNSSTNGHKWGNGATGTASQFGDKRSIDTWAFVVGPTVEISTTVDVKEADLKISHMSVNKTSIAVGESLAIKIKIKNEGPDDVTKETLGTARFALKLPAGFVEGSASPIFVGEACGSEEVNIRYNSETKEYSSELNLLNQCEVAYIITIKAENPQVGSTLDLTASVYRPIDTRDPHSDCIGSSDICNNIHASQITINSTVFSGECVKPGATGTPTLSTKVGILTKDNVTSSTGKVNWPENVPNGHLVIDSSNKGLIITHMTTEERDLLVPVAGMLIYNTTNSCVELYRGPAPTVDNTRVGWNCIERGCND